MKISKKKYIENAILDNLLLCGRICAEKGDAKGTVVASKTALRLSKKLENEVFEVRPESCAQASSPPENRENDIADSKG